ncbi:MAG: hypothetical protein A2W91_11260 [Bacteroidetes bacterium GWF2_38_335]|nr:MAG: hypothetical protein A2W91_11260 [Bacteroidetes bacterium GWF2_38_335]OFY81725.1 MAG: hypothetical protein A2281_05780 [Bacteroidetes bacterium RIFOXYA12_FULL_38_20]HBS87789.1 hypothetical protein [Bacteroidales bacterium]
MKTTAKYTAILIGMILLLTSCSTQFSIQKRRYSSGFNVELVNGKQQKIKNTETEPKPEIQESIDTIQTADNSNITENIEKVEEECGMESAVNEIKSIKKIDVEKNIKSAPVIKNLMNIKCGGLMKYSGSYEDDYEKENQEMLILFDVLLLILYMLLGILSWSFTMTLIYFLVTAVIGSALYSGFFYENESSILSTLLYSILISLIILIYFALMILIGFTFIQALVRLLLVLFLVGFIIYKIISLLEESGGCWGG